MNKKYCIIVISIFLLIKLLTLNFYKNIWWDSAVYIGMGKYIYSLGNAGLWENTRPIILPLLLGFLWKTGLNLTIIRVVEIVFGSLCILLVYLIGKKLFDEKIALVSSILLAISPTFFFFNGIILTEVVSTFFALLGIFYLTNQKKYLSGFFFGIAFLTRFIQLFVFIAVILTLLIQINKKNVKNLFKLIIGFIIAIAPFLILNYVLYNSVLFPFLQQISLSKISGWLNFRPPTYYFIELFKENFLYLLSIFGGLLIFKNKDREKMLPVAAFFLLFMFFNLIKQKEMRFLIILFPYMYLLVSYSLMHFLDYFKKIIAKKILIILIIASIITSLNTSHIYYKNELNKNNKYDSLQNKFEENNINGKIWISNPIIPILSNKKIDKLVYYPVFNENNQKALIKEAENADFIFIDSCDLACKSSDLECEDNKNELLLFLKKELKIIYSSEFDKCSQFIFQR